MIIGLFLRNYKTYQGINYIPLSNGSFFTAIVGENGSGKSSVLEALDSFFNNSEWNFNHSLSKGFSEREPYICPMFLIKKDTIESEQEESINLLSSMSDLIWDSAPTEFNSSTKPINSFCNHRELLIEQGHNRDNAYFVPMGIIKTTPNSTPSIYLSIFESIEAISKLKKNPRWLAFIQDLQDYTLKNYQYIYIPSEINFKEYTKIESKTVQALLGKKIEEIVRSTIKRDTISDINKKLNSFLDDISETLQFYEYKKPAKKQNLFNQSHLTQKVIEAFFESKILTKKIGKESVPVNNLSSGEKRQALIDIARAFLLKTERAKNQHVIFAIDEPELSLHISACFEQFEKIKDISEAKVQSIITTHWYGFMPVVSDGVAIYCPNSELDLVMIDLRCFREDIAKLRRSTQGKLPSDFELKGLNDLVQSIIASITGKDYKWIICEGSADKIYLDFYLNIRKLFILPVGGSKYVKKIYKYLEMALEDNRDGIKGSVYLILDTDKAFEKYEANDSMTQIKIRRIHNDTNEYSTLLKTTSNTEYHPPTVIEDTLKPNTFIQALQSFSDDEQYGELVKKILPNMSNENENWPAALAYNLRGTDQKVMDQLFNMPKFKIKFALKYTQLANDLDRPSWMEEIRLFLFPPRKRITRTSRPAKES